MIHYMTTIGVGGAWVANELRVLAANDVPFVLHALRRPEDTFYGAQDIETFDRETRALYPLPRFAFVRNVLAAPFRFRGRFIAAAWNALTGERESLRGRAAVLWHFLVACHWAAALRNEQSDHIHSQWIHSGGTVAMYGAWLTGTSFSFTGHAADLFRDRVALRDKIRRADFIVCISEFHRQFFLEHGARPDQLFIAHCGIDTGHFTPATVERDPDAPFHILSSGRLVEKKGFDILIEACALLHGKGQRFQCTIAGSGPLENDLRTAIRSAGLDDVITVTGVPIKQEDIPAFMATGDVYCLPCVWASDNDVDGLPMMLMEAMACGLPAVSTRLVGIPDLVRHDETGLLAEPADAAELAEALLRLKTDPANAARLAKAGQALVREEFNIDTCLAPLLERYRERLTDTA